MREHRFKRLSIRKPAILFALVLVFAIGLTVLWNVVLVHDYNQLKELAGGGSFHGAFIVVGSALFLAIIVLSTILGIQLIANLRWSQRQSNFIASVTHELNSPLSSIKLFAQTLRSDSLSPEDHQRFLGKILVDVERLSRIIANVLRAAEVDNRGAELTVAPVEIDLCAYLHEYLEDATTIYQGQIELSLHGEEAWVEIDPLMFHQVLDNLVDNAMRYRSEAPARVELHIVPVGAWIELQVKDHGIGIPDAMLEDFLELFYRIEEGEPQTGRRGMGVGLHIVRSIVRSHGGTVGARSAGAGSGAVIWIRLPALPREVAHR